MSSKTIKILSFTLVAFASVLLILDIIDVHMVNKTETGLLDDMPGFLRTFVFFGYPIILLTSYILFLVSKKAKIKYDHIAGILFLLNGVGFIFLLFILFTDMGRRL